MIRKILKHVLRTLACILLAVVITTVIVQLTVYKEKANISVSTFDFIKADDPVFLTAHRGVNASSPENSLPAFEKSVEMEFYAAECDIRLTNDNVWVLSHDDIMFLHFWSFKKISKNSYFDIKKLTYKNGANLSKHYNETIPTLEEYLDLFKNTETRPQIEIKSSGSDNLELILNALDEKGLREKAIIISFEIEQLEKIRKIDKNIELWYLAEDFTAEKEERFNNLGTNKKLAIKLSAFTDEQINEISSSGITIAAWTVDKVEALERAYNLGIRYITTNIFTK